MPKYVIEREIPGAGKLTTADLQGISAKSCSVLRDLGPSIQSVESYVTDDKIYCLYIAPDERWFENMPAKAASRPTRCRKSERGWIPTTAE